MKTILIFLIIFLPLLTLGQQENVETSHIKSNCPTFTGIENYVEFFNYEDPDLLKNYVCSRVKKSDWAPKLKVEGTEVIKFTVDEKGRLSNFKVVNSVSSQIDEELIKILKTTDGMWKPAMKDSRPITMDKEVSLSFVCFEKKECQDYLKAKARKNFIKGNELMFVKNNPNKALKYYNTAVNYCPFETSSLLLRGVCKYENGDKEGAFADWERVNELGKMDASEYIDKLIKFDAYTTMTQVLNK